MPALRIVTRIQDADDYGGATDGQYLKYDAASGHIIGGAGGGGGVSAPLTLTLADAGTSTPAVVETLGHNSSNTPAAGFGTTLKLQAKSLSGPDQDQGAVVGTWYDPAGGSFLSLQARQAGGALADRLRVGGTTVNDPLGNGTVTEVGAWVDQGALFQMKHQFWDGFGVDQWSLVLHPPSSFSLPDLALTFGYLYNQPGMTLKGMSLTFADAQTSIEQHSYGLIWNQPDNHYIQWGSPDGHIYMTFGHTYGLLIGQNYGSTPLLQIRPSQAIVASQDLLFSSNSYGPVVADQSNGHTYRIITTGGVLGVQLVS